MSVAATSTQNLSSMILQQLLSSSNAQATSGLSSSVLEQVLASTGATTQTTASQTEVPAAISQALGELLSGSNPTGASSDLSQVQSYFQQNPAALTSLMSSLQNGAGTYSADGTVSSGSSLLSALGGSGSSSSNSSLIGLLLGGQSQDPLLASLGGSSNASTSAGLSMLG